MVHFEMKSAIFESRFVQSQVHSWICNDPVNNFRKGKAMTQPRLGLWFSAVENQLQTITYIQKTYFIRQEDASKHTKPYNFPTVDDVPPRLFIICNFLRDLNPWLWEHSLSNWSKQGCMSILSHMIHNVHMQRGKKRAIFFIPHEFLLWAIHEYNTQ
jgi:hypothetical protein